MLLSEKEMAKIIDGAEGTVTRYDGHSVAEYRSAAEVAAHAIHERMRDDVAEFKAENERLRRLLKASCQFYQKGHMDGEKLQWLGIYITRWDQSMPEPTMGFRQWCEEEIDEALQSDSYIDWAEWEDDQLQQR